MWNRMQTRTIEVKLTEGLYYIVLLDVRCTSCVLRVAELPESSSTVGQDALILSALAFTAASVQIERDAQIHC